MRNNLKLNARLEMIAEKIPHCRILTDIGTDHAYIPIYAVMNGHCSKSLAADLREGPLGMACANIKRYGLEKHIETRLGNGLKPIALNECDVVVIAGMGGSLIRDILSSSVEKAQKAQLLLLQPNNAADVLRKWLCENGFEIGLESLVIDAGKLYCLISAKWTGRAAAKDEFAYYIGDVLIDNGDPLLRKYIEKKVKELGVVISGRARSRTEKGRAADNGENKSMGPVVECVGCSPMHPERMMSILAGMDTEKCIQIRNRLVKLLETI